MSRLPGGCIAPPDLLAGVIRLEDVWMCGCVDVWMGGCVDVWMCGCMDGGMGQDGGWVDGLAPRAGPSVRIANTSVSTCLVSPFTLTPCFLPPSLRVHKTEAHSLGGQSTSI